MPDNLEPSGSGNVAPGEFRASDVSRPMPLMREEA
jgi:hypothetical protein